MRDFSSSDLTIGRPQSRFVRRALRLTLIALLLGLGNCSKTSQRQIPVTRLSGDFEPLREQFNRDAGKVRVLMLLDPT